MSDLHVLARTGDIEGVHEMLRRGADPNIKFLGEAPLHCVAAMDVKTPEDVENSLKEAEELIKRGADVNRCTRDGMTPLMLAVRAVNCSLVELLLNAGADINMKDRQLNSAIHYAALNFHKTVSTIQDLPSSKLEILETLLKKKPKLDVFNEVNYTPLYLSMRSEKLPVVQRLLNHGASVNLLDFDGLSVLHDAFFEVDDIDMWYELLRYGGDLGIKEASGDTPLDNYLEKSDYYFRVKLKEAKSVFKVSILLQAAISSELQQNILKKSKELFEFIPECRNEINKMLEDELAPNYCVHKVALRGFLKSAENDPVPDDDDVFDKVINKIIEGDYFIYGDMIVNGIRSSYWKKKFAEICSDRTNKTFLIYDELYKLSFYLSRLEMLSLMVACAAKDKWDITSHIWNITPPIRHRTMM